MPDKTKLRELVLKKLKSQPQELRQKKSGVILEKLRRALEFQKARAIMFYVALTHEVDMGPFLEEALGEGRCVTVPYVDKKNGTLIPIQIEDPKKDLVVGSYGILEPRPELALRSFDANRLDLVLVPGLAFDLKGHRLGRGKGYYDRFLKTLPRHVKRFGLAFDFQVLDSVPVTNSDVSVDEVITNE